MTDRSVCPQLSGHLPPGNNGSRATSLEGLGESHSTLKDTTLSLSGSSWRSGQQRDAAVAVPTMNSIVSALRFVFTHTLDRPDLARKLVRRVILARLVGRPFCSSL